MEYIFKTSLVTQPNKVGFIQNPSHCLYLDVLLQCLTMFKSFMYRLHMSLKAALLSYHIVTKLTTIFNSIMDTLYMLAKVVYLCCRIVTILTNIFSFFMDKYSHLYSVLWCITHLCWWRLTVSQSHSIIQSSLYWNLFHPFMNER